MVPTTSRHQRRIRGRGGSGNPIKRIKLTVTLSPADAKELARQAAERGVSVDLSHGALSFTADSPDEALERLRVLGDLLAPKR